jgi:ribonucleoside-diphosphate reductase alpha chain
LLSKSAVDLFQKRYASKGETPDGVCNRVAKVLAIRDKKFEEELCKAMMSGIFLPNSPTIVNAGKKNGMLSACFVLPIEDSIESIFDTQKSMAKIFQRGGGVGINFSSLRPKNASLSTGGTSSGALSFMGIFNKVTDVVKQGGFRRGAGMGGMNFNHPEITDFCRAKLDGYSFKNFNLSVVVTDDFMEKAVKGGKIELGHGKVVYNSLPAKGILDLIAFCAWQSGDPGILFYDRMNKDNKLYPTVNIEVTNPCGEVPLPPYGACTLGSVNISKMVEGDKFNFDMFAYYCALATRALLNCNMMNWYPIGQIAKTMRELNPIGVGIMGFADALIMLGINYDSKECLEFIDQLSKPYVEATNAVATDSFYRRSIAPTGSLSILADCSSGIEPVFDSIFERHLTIGVVEETRDIYTSKYLRTAHQVSPEWHLKVQAQFQKYVDAGVSKTVNLPNDVDVDTIKDIYIKAWKLGCKGITVYRDECKEGVLVSTRVKCEGDTCVL